MATMSNGSLRPVRGFASAVAFAAVVVAVLAIVWGISAQPARRDLAACRSAVRAGEQFLLAWQRSNEAVLAGDAAGITAQTARIQDLTPQWQLDRDRCLRG